MDDKIVVKTYESRFEADVDHRKLADENIESWIIDKKDSAYVMIGEVELYVSNGDLKRAAEILN